jgi:hypothetical protein
VIVGLAAERTSLAGPLGDRAPRDTRRSAAPAEAAVSAVHSEKGFPAGAAAAAETAISAVAFATTAAASEVATSALR